MTNGTVNETHFSPERWERLLAVFRTAHGRLHLAMQATDRLGAERAMAELEAVFRDLAAEAGKPGAPQGLREMMEMERIALLDARAWLRSLRTG